MSKNIPTEKNLQHDEAIAKFKQLVETVNTCMFTTMDDNMQLFSRPMATVHVDEQGNAWFFTNEFSEKVSDISRDNSVHLIYAHPKHEVYFTVKGICTVVVDRSKIAELWRPSMKSWLPEGMDDPKLCLLKVITESAYYWNTSSKRMSVFFNKLKGKGEKSEMGKLKLEH
jgi:general stress protein 26